jgi:SNF2 family DNA or RNA helicase
MEHYLWFLNKSKLDFKQYQYDGVKWASENELQLSPQFNVRGGFIADEMGLGKTIIMLGLLFANCITKTLIVLPNSLIVQWQSEIFRTTGHKAIIYHGQGKKKITAKQIEKSFIVLTSYSTIALSKKKYANKDSPCLLHQIQWNRLVFDEAHNLRNNTSRYYGARMIESRIRWFISGTPIQNTMKDFYRLCSLLRLPASFYTDKEMRIQLLETYMLKRTKKEVGIQIPQMILENKTVLWQNEKERKIAEIIHEKLKTTDEKLRFIQYAQKMCILPKMVLNKFGVGLEMNANSKLNSVIQKIVERKDNGCGSLVFCQFYDEIDFIIATLIAEGITNINHFDGRVSPSDRVKRLTTKYDVLIIQIKTGCEGLNLQKNYSDVYFVSPTWNPAVESQAIARCHRIGQTKEVCVFKFEMNEFNLELPTMDKYINDIQSKKTALYF